MSRLSLSALGEAQKRSLMEKLKVGQDVARACGLPSEEPPSPRFYGDLVRQIRKLVACPGSYM